MNLCPFCGDPEHVPGHRCAICNIAVTRDAPYEAHLLATCLELQACRLSRGLPAVAALKPCPFCDGAVEIREHTKSPSTWRFFVEHVDKPAPGVPEIRCPLGDFRERSVELAAAAWNRRPSEGELVRLREAVERANPWQQEQEKVRLRTRLVDLVEAVEVLFQEWINGFGGVGDCEKGCGDSPACIGQMCSVCDGCMTTEEVDLDPGHDENCIQMRTCRFLTEAKVNAVESATLVLPQHEKGFERGAQNAAGTAPAKENGGGAEP